MWTRGLLDHGCVRKVEGLRRNFPLCDAICSTNILSSLKVRAARNWDDCTLAASYQEISNVKRNITAGCSRLKRPSYVFSTTRDCARVIFKQFSFHLRTMRERKKNLKTSVYHRMKVRKTSAVLLLFDERIEKPSWLNFNPIAEVGVNRCLSHNLFLVYIVFLRCKCSN